MIARLSDADIDHLERLIGSEFDNEVSLTGEQMRSIAAELRERRAAEPPKLDHVNLIADPAREMAAGLSNIYVRAWIGQVNGPIKTVDIAQLDLPSLLAWTRSRGGMNKFAEQALALILGHDPNEVQRLFGEGLLRV